MREMTVHRVPLIAGEAGWVSRTALDLGLPHSLAFAWLRICQQVRSHCLFKGWLKIWPPVVMYATAAEAIRDQIANPSGHRRLTQFIRQTRGWSVFGECHDHCHRRWGGLDRSVLHLQVLAGNQPITETLLHEVGHHHLYQVHGITYRQHLAAEVERQIDTITRPWLAAIGPCTAADDHPATIRALDILLAERSRR